MNPDKQKLCEEADRLLGSNNRYDEWVKQTTACLAAMRDAVRQEPGASADVCPACGGYGDSPETSCGCSRDETPPTASPPEPGAGQPVAFMKPNIQPSRYGTFIPNDPEDTSPEEARLYSIPLYAHPPASTPSAPGFVLVPVEPDSNMMNAARDPFLRWKANEKLHGGNVQKLGIAIYRAMINARPQSATPPPAAQSAWMPIESCPETVGPDWRPIQVLLWIEGKGACRGSKFTRDDGIIWNIEGTSAHENLMVSQGWPLPTRWMMSPAPPATPERQGRKP